MSDAGWGAPAPNDDTWSSAPPAAPTAAPPSHDEMFGAPSVPSGSFDGPPGTRCGGIIVELPDAIQKRSFDTKEPLFWPAAAGQPARPKWIWPVHYQTDLRDPNIQDDDGVRAVYLEYKKMDAVKAAVKAAGAVKLEVGGELWLEFYAYQGKTKLYRATYRPPGAAAPAPVQRPAQQSAPDPWQGLNAPAVAELTARGLRPEQVLPHIQGRSGWEGASAQQILGVVPKPAESSWGGGYAADEPPF